MRIDRLVIFLLSQGSPGNLTQFEDILYSSSNSSQSSSGVISCKLATENGVTVGDLFSNRFFI